MEQSTITDLLERFANLTSEQRTAALPILSDILTGKIRIEDAAEKLSSYGITL